MSKNRLSSWKDEGRSGAAVARFSAARLTPRDRRRHAGQVALRRPKPLEDGVEARAVAVEALAEPADQQLQVCTCVGVERGQDLVRVDVGRGVRDGNRVAVVEPPPAGTG